MNGAIIINSDQILQMPEISKTFIVVGGGVIGVEYACMFAILGSRVILVEKRRAYSNSPTVRWSRHSLTICATIAYLAFK